VGGGMEMHSVLPDGSKIMSIIKQKYLKDENGEVFSPIVSIDSVYTSNGQNLTTILNDKANSMSDLSWKREYSIDVEKGCTGLLSVAWSQSVVLYYIFNFSGTLSYREIARNVTQSSDTITISTSKETIYIKLSNTGIISFVYV
jgi:hypothetical protein